MSRKLEVSYGERCGWPFSLPQYSQFPFSILHSFLNSDHPSKSLFSFRIPILQKLRMNLQRQRYGYLCWLYGFANVYERQFPSTIRWTACSFDFFLPIKKTSRRYTVRVVRCRAWPHSKINWKPRSA